VTLEYARDGNRPGPPPRGGGEYHQRDRDRERGEDYHERDREDRRAVKCDWLCDSCGCQNFARRSECYRCSLPKSESSVLINSNDPYADAVVISPSPTSILVVKGLSLYTTEDQISEAFRQFAVVKNVRIIRDRITGASKGLAFIEFPSIDYAGHSLRQASAMPLVIDKAHVKISFAKEGISQSLATVSGGGGGTGPQPNLYAAAALQAAQWSANNGYAMACPTIASSFPTPAPLTSSPAAMTLSQAAGVRQKPQWPPRFESHGASYVFQPKSGCFYEPISGYYYCPKSKLYYCSSRGLYYKAVGPPVGLDMTGEDSTFVPFHPPVPTESEDNPTPQKENTVLEDLGTAGKGGRKPVVLSMSLGMFKSKSSSKPVKKDKDKEKDSIAPAEAVGIGTTTVFRKGAVTQSIAKWEELKKKEEIQETASSGEKSISAATTSRDSSPTHISGKTETSTHEVEMSKVLKRKMSEDMTTTAPVPVPVPVPVPTLTTTPSQPVCLLCRRQFASMEVLHRHEKESKLHAENLAKKLQAESESGQSQSGAVYRDRASERRATYGQSSIPDPIIKRRSRSRSRSRERYRRRDVSLSVTNQDTEKQITSSTATVSEDLNNPGNQMLRRLGWQDGQGLGKDGTGIRDPVSVKSQEASSKTGVGSSGKCLPPIEYGEGRVYKESLLRAARARFEQVEEEQEKHR